MKVRIIVTGGTFDKHYDELFGKLTFKDSHLEEILHFVRCTFPVEVEINQLVDSLDMQHEDRQKIVDSCLKCDEQHIIIIHGTDTMVETAQLLNKIVTNKTIVLTGAMIPYIFRHSDAVFNLGTAVAAVKLLENGVYIVMNGKVFNSYNVRKNKELGIFEEKE